MRTDRRAKCRLTWQHRAPGEEPSTRRKQVQRRLPVYQTDDTTVSWTSTLSTAAEPLIGLTWHSAPWRGVRFRELAPWLGAHPRRLPAGGRSPLAFWMGGAGATPVPSTSTAAAGRSMLAFWMGGGRIGQVRRRRMCSPVAEQISAEPGASVPRMKC